MSDYTQDMTKGSLWKQIAVFSLPLMLTNVLQVLFNMSDIAVVGRFGGPEALGAVGSTVTLAFLFTGFLLGLGGGVNVLVARHYGAREVEDLHQLIHTAAVVCFLCGVVIFILGEGFSGEILRILGTKDELIEGAKLYLRIYFLGMPAMAIYNFGNGVLSAVGDTRRPLRYLLIAGFINVALNVFFVVVCHRDVDGVAAASVIAEYISAALIVIALLRTKDCYGLRISELCLNGKKAKDILALGIPAGFQFAIFAIANLFIQAGINRFDAVTVEGNSAAANADTLVYDVLNAIYTACASFIGQNFGAGDQQRIKKSYLISLIYSVAVGAILGGAAAIFSRSFLSLFTAKPDVIAAGRDRLIIMGCSYFMSAFMDNTTAACRGLGKSFVPTVIVIMGSCVFRVIWVYTIFTWIGTTASLYLLYIFSWALTAAAQMIYFRHCYRKETRLIAVQSST